MTEQNDLVEQLEESAKLYDDAGLDGEFGANLMRAAKGEIERLQAKCWRMKEDRDRAIQWRDKDTEELIATKDKLAKAVDALELADNNLTNLQPKIANGLVRSDWVPVFDGYIDPVIQAARAALTQKDTVHD